MEVGNAEVPNSGLEADPRREEKTELRASASGRDGKGSDGEEEG